MPDDAFELMVTIKMTLLQIMINLKEQKIQNMLQNRRLKILTKNMSTITNKQSSQGMASKERTNQHLNLNQPISLEIFEKSYEHRSTSPGLLLEF